MSWSVFPAAQTLPFAFSGAIGALWVPWERFVDVLGAARSTMHISSSMILFFIHSFVVFLLASFDRLLVCLLFGSFVPTQKATSVGVSIDLL